MSVSHVQNANSGVSGTTTATFGSAITTGNLVVGALNLTSTTDTLTSISDGTNTYTVLDRFQGASTLWFYTFYKANVTGGPTTITISTSNSANAQIIADEFSGLTTSSPLDQHTRQEQSTTTPSSGSVTTTVAGELIYSVCSGDAVSNPTFAAGSGYTLIVQLQGNTGNTFGIGSEYQIQGSAGSISATWSTSVSEDYVVFLQTFTPAGAPSISPYPPRRIIRVRAHS